MSSSEISDLSSSDTSEDMTLYSESLFDHWSETEHAYNELVQANTSVRKMRASPKLRDRQDFKRLFRMIKRFLIRTANDLEENFPYFQQKPDCRGKMGFSTLQKCTAVVRLLAYGTTSDLMDDYLQNSECTARECMFKFCRKVYKLYHKKYIRKPNANYIRKLYAFHENEHGFPGMLGSLDCTHWDWENCPNAYRGYYTRGDNGVPTIILEVVSSYDMWIWHAFFGVAGSNNDLNVIRQSDVFTNIFTGKASDSSFEVNGARYKHGYYLVDGIYPEWTTLVKAYSNPPQPDRKLFKEKQESARKDIERTFCRLKKKCHVLKRLSRSWHTRSLHKIVYATIILHNMILEDNNHAICRFEEETPPPQPALALPNDLIYFERISDVLNMQTHHNIRHDLTTHLWVNRQTVDVIGSNN